MPACVEYRCRMLSNVSPGAIAPIGAAVAIGVGGFCGAIARWGTSMLADALLGNRFPFGTLGANLLGCFLIGLLKTSFDRGGASPVLTLALLTGFLGAYTTFSTFSLDTVALARATGARGAAVYVTVSVVGGLALCLAGVRLGGGLR